MTIWRRFATSVKISKLLTALFALAALKIGLMFFLGMDFSDWDVKPAQLTPQAVMSANAASQAKPQAAPQAATPPAQQPPAPAAAPQAKPGQAAPEQAPSDPLNAQTLRQKQDELNRREQALNAMEKELEAKLQRLQALEGHIKSMLDQADALKDQKIKHLIDVYSNMKAKQAAEVLGTLDEDVSVKILSGMKGKLAGEILNFVEPKKAARLSLALTKMQTPFQN